MNNWAEIQITLHWRTPTCSHDIKQTSACFNNTEQASASAEGKEKHLKMSQTEPLNRGRSGLKSARQAVLTLDRVCEFNKLLFSHFEFTANFKKILVGNGNDGVKYQ